METLKAPDAAEPDADPSETQEWLDALAGTVRAGGSERGTYLLKRLSAHAQELGLVDRRLPYSAYQNTIGVERQGIYPGDLELEERITSIVRWNALAMVVRANKCVWRARRPHRELRLGRRDLRSRVSTISFAPRAIRRPAISCFSSRTRRPASTRAHFSKGA